jgi:calcineurin-like phosphoesterase family protein
MKTYFTADTHFDHANIIQHCGRPFAAIEEMNEAIVEVWNKTVLPGDEVFHLGDLAWSRPDCWVHRLHGRIHLIRGNHDTKASSLFVTMKDCWIKKSIKGKKVTLCHYPWESWPGAYMLHGHSHGNCPQKLNRFDVGWDVWGKPVTLEEIIS